MRLGYLKKPSVIILILSNAIPLVGVLFYNWNALNVIALYWLENLVIVVYSSIKVGMCKFEDAGEIRVTSYSRGIDGKTKYAKPTVLPAKYLPVIYGLSRLMIIIPIGFFLYFSFFIFGSYGLAQIFSIDLMISFLFLLVSHGVSFLYNFIGQKEYLYIRSIKEIEKTETGLLALYFAMMAGSWLVPMFLVRDAELNPLSLVIYTEDVPKIVLAVLIVVKIKFDLRSHIKRHSKVLNASAQIAS